MTDIAIKVENLSKRYRLGQKEEHHDTFGGALADFVRRPWQNVQQLRQLTRFETNEAESDDILWALRDVSFEVKQGEVVGIIGRNGAGKSTLLKIVSNITKPTSGRVTLNGRVASLLEVGTGFHPELTGSENVYLNGTILGMTKTEIDRKFDEIVDFAGVEKFIDTPVKRYSSGMQVRLAFSIAAHLEPEILLVDEVLAVGDAAFQKKCLGKIGQVTKEGRTVFFVSHNMPTIQALCSRCVLLDQGSLQIDSIPDTVVSHYLSSAITDKSSVSLDQHPGRDKGCIRIIESISLLNGDGLQANVFSTGQTLSINLKLDPPFHLQRPILGVGINTILGQRIFTVATYFNVEPLPPIREPCEIFCTIPGLPLTAGRYTLDVSAGNSEEGLLDHVKSVLVFDVMPIDYFGTGVIPSSSQGPVVVRATWNLNA